MGALDAGDLATPEAFERAPVTLVWGWYEWRRMKVLQSQPNHLALARLAARGPQVTVITQNVDDLHERAGAARCITRMAACMRRAASSAAVLTASGRRSPRTRRWPPPGAARLRSLWRRFRPGVVWFGEMLPEDAWRAATEAIAHCEVMITIGTSGWSSHQACPGWPRAGQAGDPDQPTATEHDDCAAGGAAREGGRGLAGAARTASERQPAALAKGARNPAMAGHRACRRELRGPTFAQHAAAAHLVALDRFEQGLKLPRRSRRRPFAG